MLLNVDIISSKGCCKRQGLYDYLSQWSLYHDLRHSEYVVLWFILPLSRVTETYSFTKYAFPPGTCQRVFKTRLCENIILAGRYTSKLMSWNKKLSVLSTMSYWTKKSDNLATQRMKNGNSSALCLHPLRSDFWNKLLYILGLYFQHALSRVCRERCVSVSVTGTTFKNILPHPLLQWLESQAL